MTMGTSTSVVLGILDIIDLKNNIAELTAQEGVIVKITYCFILKYKLIVTITCFLSVKYLDI